MYFAVETNGLVISYGPEDYPGSHYVDDDMLPENWNEIFCATRLGYRDGEFFVMSEQDLNSEVVADAAP